VLGELPIILASSEQKRVSMVLVFNDIDYCESDLKCSIHCIAW
jgi:hypothetical protein